MGWFWAGACRQLLQDGSSDTQPQSSGGKTNPDPAAEIGNTDAKQTSNSSGSNRGGDGSKSDPVGDRNTDKASTTGGSSSSSNNDASVEPAGRPPPALGETSPNV